MANLKVNRSVRFVSLDTHPANNSLVLTYEILVTVNDANSKHELSRRTKRDQLQMVISELDKMGATELEKSANLSTLKLRELAQAIMQKCPLFEQLDASQTLEDIQLHLLYLINRKRCQIYQATRNQERAPSAASSRLRSATPTGGGARPPSARQKAARDGRRSSLSNASDQSRDCYAALYEDELKASRGCTTSFEVEQDLQEEFLKQFLQHLSNYEPVGKIDETSRDRSSELDAQLEALYGDLGEKIAAMQSISELTQDDRRLLAFEPDRLLVTAILRTLQDSEARDARLSGLILFCLVRFTQFRDVHDRVFNRGEPIDLARLVVDLIEEQARLAAKCDQLRPILDNFYHLNSALVILSNLMNLDEMSGGNSTRKRLIQGHGKRLAANLIGLYVALSRHLTRDLRGQSSGRYERLTLLLANLTRATRALSIFREFTNLLRVQSQTMTESLINCINSLQLSRPGSGSVQQPSAPPSRLPAQQVSEEQFFVRDQSILCEIYKLEIDLLKLVGNLIHDTRFKLRFSRKSLLLKCVLRNLVVFLASSRRSNTLAPYERSSVLLVPLKCLYELSCHKSTTDELFKSKIVLKCLLEYLLSCTADLKMVLDSLSAAGSKETPKREKNLLEDDQIILEPRLASHYITAIWINLSAKQAAPFFSAQVDRELSELIADYISLANLNLETHLENISARLHHKRDSTLHQEAPLNLYLHAKLLRNLTQFLKFPQAEPLMWAKQYGRWMEQQSRSVEQLLKSVRVDRRDALALPMLVECIASLTHLITSASPLWRVDGEMSFSPVAHWPQRLEPILNQMLETNLTAVANLEGGENDDLLLVSINLVGALARSGEICDELRKFAAKLVALCNFTLETKLTDVEMLVSCLFMLRHLLNHWAFLKSLGADLEDQRPEVGSLIDALSSLVMHGEPAVSKLSNMILNALKQFEEQQSLADSVACRQRFVCYNEKWLSAIRANRDGPGASVADAETTLLMEAIGQRGRELEANDEFDQLRTVALNGGSASVSRMSTSSSNRSSTLPEESTLAFANASKLARQIRDDHSEDEDLDSAGQEDEEEETFSEPDLNVIDANSMIKHLTDRRQFRAELMTMRRA